MTDLDYVIFVVDDEESIRDAAKLNLTQYEVYTFATAEEAIDALDEIPCDLMLMDIGLPGIDGVQALEIIRKKWPDILFIMITAYEDVATVVKAMKLGAFDYIVKPLHMDTLKTAILNALQSIGLRKEVRLLQEQCLKENLPCFIAQSNNIQTVMEFVRQVAQSPDAPVLIVGETGTGKELVAKAIHYQSPNYRGALVTLNCAAIPNEIVESELFGYESGAFSGAKPGGKQGLVELANNGTLFLDEVADLSLEAQAKLLRFLDSQDYYKVGGTVKRKANVRIVTATNRNLEQMVKEKSFRSDLYFRLAMIKVEVPSLNTRREDIKPIAGFFLEEMNQKYERKFIGFSQHAAELLKERNYKGNIRELKGIIERGVLTGDEPLLTVGSLGLSSEKIEQSNMLREGFVTDELPAKGIDLDQVLESVEKQYIFLALKKTLNNDKNAAKLLGMNYHTFRYRKKKFFPN